MMKPLRAGLIGALLFSGVAVGLAEQVTVDDPTGIIKKPIPDKTIVFTFDDGCASHATVAAPLLKKNGYSGTFYVSDAYLFRERKDWYMTWSQIRTVSEQGFEIGNHTRGHGQLSHTDIGGCKAYVWTLEDEMIASRVPKSTTFCWPFYCVNTNFYPLLKSWGYLFARGGHYRTYRPTVDNPFDVPSFAVGGVGMNMQGFISSVQQAVAGRVVVLCFHGVPDMEHAGCGTDPDLFEDMVDYLKENNYKVIALRDLAEYIDVEKAAKLPPTQTKLENPGPELRVQDDKPYVAKKRDRKSYEFPSELTGPWKVKELFRLNLPGSVSGAINGSKITLFVPASANVKALAPVFELGRFVKATPKSGTVRDFSTPQIYTVTAQDGSTRDYTVQAVPTTTSMSFSWTSNSGGSFEDATQWKDNLRAVVAPAIGGNSDTILEFYAPGKYAVTRESASDFVLNQLNFGTAFLTLKSKGALVFTKRGSQGSRPYMNSQSRAIVTVNAPLRLDDDLTLDGIETDNTRVYLPGLISGSGGLIKNGTHAIYVGYATNTYSGGTIINEGSISFSSQGLGAGPVTVGDNGSIGIGGAPVMNKLTANGGCVFSGGRGRWSGPVTLTGNTKVNTIEGLEFDNTTEGISGPGGLTETGQRVDHGTKCGTIKLSGRNTYTGATRVEMGLLEVRSSLYGNEPARWTPANITVNGAAGELRLHVGGAGEFTAMQAGTMLKNICTGVNNNGLMAGATFSMDTTDAADVQELSTAIVDSNGPGGGRIHIKKCGAGTLQLSGANTYSGQTILTGGTLSVASLNRVVNGKASSSLGAPKNPADAEIVISGGSTLLYTGKGETTDRNFNLPGGRDTITLDHSGTGLLKLTSPFVMSGFAESKTIVLTGSSASVGELAFDIENVYDRNNKATTSVTKAGTGTWVLSGKNSYSGETMVKQGTLQLASAQSLGEQTEVTISEGAVLDLSFTGEMKIGKLYLDGKLQPAGVYNAEKAPKFIKGKGALKNQ